MGDSDKYFALASTKLSFTEKYVTIVKMDVIQE